MPRLPNTKEFDQLFPAMCLRQGFSSQLQDLLQVENLWEPEEAWEGGSLHSQVDVLSVLRGVHPPEDAFPTTTATW